MSLISYKLGQGSIVLRVKILDSAATTGAGKTGLLFSSTGLRIAAIADNEATTTAYTAAGSTTETITTLGTYAAPTATKCRFKEVDSTNHKGVYEIHLADARFAASNAKSLLVSISGATDAAETDVLIPLTQFDPYDAVRGGMTALPNAAADAAGGLPISDAGGLDIDTLLGRITANVALASVCTEARLAELDAANLPTDVAAISTLIGTPAFDVSSDIAAISTTLGTPAVSVSDDIAAIDVLIGTPSVDLATDIGSLSTTLGTPSDLGGGSDIATNLSDMAGATFSTATDSLEAIRDRGDAAWLTGGGGGGDATAANQTTILANIATAQADLDIITGATGVNLLAATQASIDAVEADTNELQTDWADGGRLDLILDTAGAGGDPWATAIPGAYGAGTAGKILGDNINAPLGTIDTVVDAIKVKTDQFVFTVANQVDANALTGGGGGDATAANQTTILSNLATVAGYLDTEIAAILEDTGTTLPATLAAMETKIDTIDGVVDSVLVDTGTTLPATLATAANLAALDTKVDTAQADLDIITGIDGVVLQVATQASIDAIEADTNELQSDDVPALIAGLNDITATQILTTQMTESYAADGVAPTLAQSLFLVQQTLTDFGIVGTDLTIRKLDGSSTAAVLTLNDASNPTDATRST